MASSPTLNPKSVVSLSLPSCALSFLYRSADLSSSYLMSYSPYTTSDKTERQLFTRDHYIEQIATMCADQELIAHDALSALINLTSSITIAARLAKIEGFITGLVRMILVSYSSRALRP